MAEAQNITKRKKVLVTGGSGQLGQSFRKIASSMDQYDFVILSREDLDITSSEHISTAIRHHRPEYLINCAAYTAVDRAEDEEGTATNINVHAVRKMAQVCAAEDVFFIHYSSDYVYDHDSEGRMTESAPTTPRGVYAKTKLLGEHEVLEVGLPSLIIRTSWVYSEFGHNFLKTMVRLGRERPALSVVMDQIGAPTYATDIATCTMRIIEGLADGAVSLSAPAIINYAGEGQISWYDFAEYIFECTDIQVDLSPITSDQYATAAPRPKWSMLDMAKIKSVFGIAPVYWKWSVKDCLQALNKQGK